MVQILNGKFSLPRSWSLFSIWNM